MPSVTLSILEGRSKEQKAQVCKEFTDTLVRVLDVDPQNVKVTIQENPLENVSKGGVLFSELKK